MPFDRAKYPADWETISADIRQRRARNQCETCGAANYAPHPITGSHVVLTVAHINHTPSDCRYNPDHYDPADAGNNLVAECQRCHNRRDAPHRAATRAAARAAARDAAGIQPLPMDIKRI